jgi:choline dehydrogenase-like flavoprotein
LGFIDKGLTVTMLESGTTLSGGLVIQAAGRNLIRRLKPYGLQERFGSRTNPKTMWVHELAPGGLSNRWTCAVPRYDPEDFVDGARVDERYRWPVTYAELERHYQRMEGVMGVSGPAQKVEAMPSPSLRRHVELPRAWRGVSQSASARGRSFVTMPLATGSGWGFKNGGTPFNSYTDVIQRLAQSGKLRVLLGAHAVRIEHDDAGEASRVIYVDRETGAETSIDCSAVVLAAGTIGTTKLLLASTSTAFPAGLGNHNGLLGRYLHDHVHDMFKFEVNRPLPRLGHEGYFTRAPYGSAEPMLAAGCVVGGRISAIDRLLTISPVPTRTFGVIIFGSMLPVEENCVQLHPNNGASGQQEIEINLRYQPQDLANTRRARDDFLEVLADAGLGPRLVWNLETPVPGSSVHYGGTVRMHASPEHGVCDAWGRLYSVPNVAVADASVFTTCVEKNPTLTAMALGHRAAERLAIDLKAGSMVRVA